MPKTLGFVLLTAFVSYAQAVDRIDASAAGQFVGQVKRVCGAVAGLRQASGDKAPTFLDLSVPPPNQPLTVVVSAKVRRAFVEPIDDRAPRLLLCATGKIEKTNDGLQVKVDEPHLLQAVEDRPREPFMPNLPRPAQLSEEGWLAPKVIKSVNPKYTAIAIKARIEGMVEIEAVIREDGTVGETRVIKSIDALFGLDVEAVKALKLWRFEPATRFGRPVAVVVVGVLRFDVF